MMSLAYWVAHVPFIDDSAYRKRRCDMWCSSADFLHTGGGDHEEHANLLAGFFMEMGMQV